MCAINGGDSGDQTVGGCFGDQIVNGASPALSGNRQGAVFYEAAGIAKIIDVGARRALVFFFSFENIPKVAIGLLFSKLMYISW